MLLYTFNSKIILGLVISLPVIFVISILFSLVLERDKNSYLSVFNQDLKRISHSTKIDGIFIGGSNTAFSISAKQVSNKSGKNFINLGRHASIDLIDYVSLISKQLDKKDSKATLIVIPEFYSYKKNIRKSAINCWLYPYWDTFSLNWYLCFPQFTKNILKMIIRGQSQQDTSNYSANFFNRFGDYEYPKTFPVKNLITDVPGYLKAVTNYKESHLINGLRHINNKIILLPPVIPNLHCKNSNFSEIDYLSLLTKVNGFKVVDTNLKICINEKYFMDTSYHTNKLYRKIRSDKVLEYLNQNDIF